MPAAHQPDDLKKAEIGGQVARQAFKDHANQRNGLFGAVGRQAAVNDVVPVGELRANCGRLAKTGWSHSIRWAWSFCSSSIITPCAAWGWTNATSPCIPCRGVSSTRRTPCARSSCRACAMSETAKQTWWLPSPLRARKRAVPLSSSVGERSSIVLMPASRNAISTPWSGAWSRSRRRKPRMLQ